jgi:hypothetical protein
MISLTRWRAFLGQATFGRLKKKDKDNIFQAFESAIFKPVKDIGRLEGLLKDRTSVQTQIQELRARLLVLDREKSLIDSMQKIKERRSYYLELIAGRYLPLIIVSIIIYLLIGFYKYNLSLATHYLSIADALNVLGEGKMNDLTKLAAITKPSFSIKDFDDKIIISSSNMK